MTKIVCRKAKLDDIPAIVDIAVESVSRDPLPVKINREAMADTARTCLNPAHFMWVAEQDGKVVASVAACVQPSFWFDKLQCSVLLYYTRAPGAGLPLLRELARWVKSRSAIKVAVLELEPDADPRLVKFLNRLGFARESLNVSYVRSAT
jgi:N-acetylglutamate synthase-like GNAT family acetyltransferase